MATMIREVYEAFRAAGVPEDKATAAAEAVEQVKETDRLRRLEETSMDIRSDLKLVKWMVGFSLAVSVATLWMVFRVLTLG